MHTVGGRGDDLVGGGDVSTVRAALPPSSFPPRLVVSAGDGITAVLAMSTTGQVKCAISGA
jgi:hypothetical protein